MSLFGSGREARCCSYIALEEFKAYLGPRLYGLPHIRHRKFRTGLTFGREYVASAALVARNDRTGCPQSTLIEVPSP